MSGVPPPCCIRREPRPCRPMSCTARGRRGHRRGSARTRRRRSVRAAGCSRLRWSRTRRPTAPGRCPRGWRRTTMRSPAGSNSAVSWSRSPQAKYVASSASASAPACLPAISTNGANAAWASSAPGTSDRHRSSATSPAPSRAAPRCRSGKNISAIWHSAASKLPSAKREGGGVAVVELDVGTDAAGDGQHRLVEVDPDDRAARCDAVGRGAGDDARAAGHVEHGLARRRRRRHRRGAVPTGRRTPERTRTRRTRQLRSGSGTTRRTMYAMVLLGLDAVDASGNCPVVGQTSAPVGARRAHLPTPTA